MLTKLWTEQDGVLSFEWTLLVVLLTFGIVAGLAAARDVMLDELGDTAEAFMGIDQSYSFAGIPALGIPGSSYTQPAHTLTECQRGGEPGMFLQVDN